MRVGIRVFFIAFMTVLASPVALADVDGLEEIIVTAQRTQESAQSIGLALSVIDGDELRDKGIEKVNDLQNATPSLEVEPAFGSGQPQFRLRGVGFIDYTANNSSPVGVYIDEVSLPFPVQTQGQLFDIARVEVLRGPQGTLYGRNTTGGAINFVTNRPTEDFHAGVSAQYGSHRAFAAEGFLSGPLSQSLRARFSWATEHGGAWQRNRLTGESLGDKDRLAGRMQLEYEPGEAVDLRLNVHLSQDRSDAYGTQLFTSFKPTSGGAVIPADTSPYATGWSLRPAFASTVGIAPESKPGVNNSNNGVDLTAVFDLGAVRLTSVSAFNRLIRRELGDWDATQYAESDIFFHDDVKVYSEEVRLASTGSGPLGWLGGVYYSNEKLQEEFYGDFTQRLGGSALTNYRQEGKSTGVFAQANYRFTDRLKGILGLRYSDETRDLIGLNTSFTGIPSLIIGGPQSRSLGNSGLDGKAELEYQLAQHSLVYGSISHGTKSGGFTAHNTVGNPNAVDAFRPEKLTAYEIGVKSDVTPTLRVNAAVFYYDYKDQQVLSKVFDTGSQSDIGRFINAPKSEIAGAELELQWRPVAGLDVSQYLRYKEGKYKAYVINSEGVDFNGKDLSFPKLSYGGDVAYGFEVGAWRLTAAMNYSYHDKYSQLFLLGPDFTVDAYWLANASLSLAPAASRSWNVSLWALNVFNERYLLTKNYFLRDTNIAAAGQPTTAGIRVDFSF